MLDKIDISATKDVNIKIEIDLATIFVVAVFIVWPIINAVKGK